MEKVRVLLDLKDRSLWLESRAERHLTQFGILTSKLFPSSLKRVLGIERHIIVLLRRQNIGISPLFWAASN